MYDTLTSEDTEKEGSIHITANSELLSYVQVPH